MIVRSPPRQASASFLCTCSATPDCKHPEITADADAAVSLRPAARGADNSLSLEADALVAAASALGKALSEAGPCALEPMLRAEVVLPGRWPG